MKPEFYMVCAWDHYYPYPGIDNIKGVFNSLAEAESYMQNLQDIPDEDKWMLKDNYAIYSSDELPWGGENESE